MNEPRLFMLLLGCKPSGRHTEQHDILFTIGPSLPDLIPSIHEFWPDAGKYLHIDAWREVTSVEGFSISIVSKRSTPDNQHLYFVNLGGYKKDEFEEYHYKMLMVADDKGKAIQRSKDTAFYKHTGFKGAESHIDDKYGIDIDNIYAINDILPPSLKEKYSILIEPGGMQEEDIIHLGYLPLSKINSTK